MTTYTENLSLVSAALPYGGTATATRKFTVSVTITASFDQEATSTQQTNYLDNEDNDIVFTLQFFPELIREGHLFILQTPLFRVRNKKKTIYCYDDDEREAAMKELGRNPEITRFKGLGEISPDEFKFMIGKDMRLDPVQMEEGRGLKEMLTFYMGKNTPDRQGFIIKNLREDVDSAEV